MLYIEMSEARNNAVWQSYYSSQRPPGATVLGLTSEDYTQLLDCYTHPGHGIVTLSRQKLLGDWDCQCLWDLASSMKFTDVAACVICLLKYRLGEYYATLNLYCFLNSLTVPCTALTAGKLPAVSAVQGDCESVYLTSGLSDNMVNSTWCNRLICSSSGLHCRDSQEDSSYHRVLCFWECEPSHILVGKHLVPKTSSRQCFQDIQNINSEYVHKT